MEEMQPGHVFTPRQTDQPTDPGTGAPEPERPPEEPAQPEPAPKPTSPPDDEEIAVAPTSPAPSSSSKAVPLADEEGWQYHSEASTSPAATPSLPEQITWTAAEFIQHDKGVNWYGALALGGILATGLIYLLTKDKITTGIVLLVVLVFGAFASRKPRELQYELNPHGIVVGSRLYPFQNYKSFSVVDEGGAASVVLTPLKRFMPLLTVYVTPEAADRVMAYLGAIMPFEQRPADAVDSLLRRIRF